MANKTDSVFLNRISKKNIHPATTKDGSREFARVSIAMKESASGFGSVSVSKGQILVCKNQDGSIVETSNNVYLGKPEQVHDVSIDTGEKDENGKSIYSTIQKTSAELLELHVANRKAWREAQKAAKAEAQATA